MEKVTPHSPLISEQEQEEGILYTEESQQESVSDKSNSRGKLRRNLKNSALSVRPILGQISNETQFNTLICPWRNPTIEILKKHETKEASQSFQENSVLALLENNLHENFRYSYKENNSPDEDPLLERFWGGSEENDLEEGNLSQNSSEVLATINLYLLNKLSTEMGFPKNTVVHVLQHYKEVIGTDIQKAIELCINAQQNGLDEIISEEESSVEGKTELKV